MRTKRSLNALTVCLTVLLLLPVTVHGQQPSLPELPAAANPPAEIQEMEAQAARQDPGERIDRARILELLEEREPGSTRLDTPRRRQAKPLPGAARPPEIARQAEGPQERRPQVPTRKEILDEIRSRPGGPELLEQARRRGAKISAAPGGPGEWLALLNPFRVREAHAHTDYSLVLTPINPRQSSPYASLYVYGATAYGSGNSTRWQLRNWSITKNGFTTEASGPQAFLLVDIPTSGWYVLNFRGYHSGSKAVLVHEPAPGTVETWDYVRGSTYRNFPTIVYLAQGWHSLSFILTAGSLRLTAVSLYSL